MNILVERFQEMEALKEGSSDDLEDRRYDDEVA